MNHAIHVRGLRKQFRNTTALDGVDFSVSPGTVFGLLGPNGAGKTTTVNILSTLLKPDAGEAWIAGFNAVTDPDQVRLRIGLTGQYASVDDLLTGRRNLELIGRLYHLSPAQAKTKADELLERFSLTDAGGRLVREYSGGMRRRLDLAASLVADPAVLFLDEPTTGLDPRSRADMWDTIRDLVRTGTTLLLTTQYLEEADLLADEIAVIDAGRIVAQGTPLELKSSIGRDQMEVTLTHPGDVVSAVGLLGSITGSDPSAEAGARHLTVSVENGNRAVLDVIRAFDSAGIGLDSVNLRQPTLDDVFLRLTGNQASATSPSNELTMEVAL